MIEPTKAVFLSYASQDAEAARRICDALRAAGIEVWFDQSELRGGDAWDQKIRRQIKECALFLPIISHHTQNRPEGYFRLEWRLADQRTHLMGRNRAFLVPICIDETPDADADVPDSFVAVQWIRLPGGNTTTAFAERVVKLLQPAEANSQPPVPARASDHIPKTDLQRPARSPRWLRPVLASAVLVIVVLGVTLFRRHSAAIPGAAAPAEAPPKSEAQALVARARAILDPGGLSREKLDAASELCERALKLDPTDATAWAQAARAELLYYFPYGFDRSPERRQRAQDRAARATSLAPDLFEVRVIQAAVFAHAVGTPAILAEAETTFRTLIRERPGDAELTRQLAEVLREEKRYGDAAKLFESIGDFEVAGWSYLQGGEFRPALAVSARGPRTVGRIQLRTLLILGADEDLDAAQATLNELKPSELVTEMPATIALRVALLRRDADRILELTAGLSQDYLDSNAFSGPRRYYTGQAYALTRRPVQAEGEWRAALATVEQRLQAAPDDRKLLLWASKLHAWLHEPAEAGRLFVRSQAVAGLDGDAADPENVDILIALGRIEPVLAGLEKFFASPPLGWELAHAELRYSPVYDSLRDNPRFVKLLHDHLPAGAKPFDEPKGAVPEAKPDARSVAVLAFDNLSDDKGNEYFSDGISEELLTVLQRIPGLHVAARTSAFYFKGRNATTQEIGQKLGVVHLIDGSVRKAGNQVRISVRLSRADTGEQLWSDSYTRDLKDVFALQTELAQTIVEQLRQRLGGDATASVAAQVEAAEKGGTRNADAHQFYLQGRYYMVRFSLDDLNRAVAFFQQAVDLDPHYARAWAAMSQAASLAAGYGNTRAEFEAGNALAAKAVDRALSLEPDLAVAYLAKGDLQSGPEFDWVGAIESYRRALELAPNDAGVLVDAGRMAYTRNQLEQAMAYFNQAERLDPANPAARTYHAFALMAASRMAEAKAQFREVIALNPSSPWSHGGMCWALVLEGDFDQALQFGQKSELAWSRRFGVALAQSGRHDAAAADAALADLIKEDAEVAAYQVAEIYAFRGEADHAFEWLERAYRQRDPGLAWLRPDRLFSKIHGDARWSPFVHKLGLADEQLK